MYTFYFVTVMQMCILKHHTVMLFKGNFWDVSYASLYFALFRHFMEHEFSLHNGELFQHLKCYKLQQIIE
jgi:hypothetical protein